MICNVEYYVDNIIDNYNLDTDNLDEVIHQYLDNHISYSSNLENIQTINDFAGGIYEAIELYKQNYGEFNYYDKEQFYAILAFQSLYNIVYNEVINNIDKINIF